MGNILSICSPKYYFSSNIRYMLNPSMATNSKLKVLLFNMTYSIKITKYINNVKNTLDNPLHQFNNSKDNLKLKKHTYNVNVGEEPGWPIIICLNCSLHLFHPKMINLISILLQIYAPLDSTIKRCLFV